MKEIIAYVIIWGIVLSWETTVIHLGWNSDFMVNISGSWWGTMLNVFLTVSIIGILVVGVFLSILVSEFNKKNDKR